ncbi:MAG TPA: indole-3-glycerol phosphate synthase TrpC [Candidatus Avalokitesvara rifleensis]|uniref:indole-3-glycerol phosphate synthase TrpC n=1 Tax=Candidatus Avalokitesvara rifleensis TaxID=3367620 RepID=UPI0027129E81|nr:indole-3-glycerol phosphate synthase TrpC [Candidatus Brocadiales bacterium]
MILDEIYRHKLLEVSQRKDQYPLKRLETVLSGLPDAYDLEAALKAASRTSGGLGLIAEVKAASPSRGVLRRDMNPSQIALEYQEGGASAISVLTDEKFFHGKLAHLEAVRRAVKLPLLRKDFIIDRYQIIEARASGADAVLLIAAILDDKTLNALLSAASQLGLGSLVEVHTEEELKRVLKTPATLIGINNRDLQTFKIDLATTLKLRPLIPDGKTVVSESGVKTRADVRLLEDAGVDAILVGEALVRSNDIGKKIRELMGWARGTD